MVSTWASGLEVRTAGGTGIEVLSGATGTAPGRGRMLMRTVSCFGPGVAKGAGGRSFLTGVREGRTIREVSPLASPTAGLAGTGGEGNAMRTVFFFGSVMGEQRTKT